MAFMVPVLAALGGGSAVAGGVIAGATALTAVSAMNQAADAHSMAHTASLQGQQIFGEQMSYAQQLQDLMAHPEKVTQLPGYEFNKQQGEESLARQMGSMGYHGSGNLGAGLIKFGQDYARNAYDDQVKLLSSLSGLQAPSSAAQMGQLAGNLQGQSNEMLGQSLAALGYLGGKMKGMGTGGAGTTEAANAPIFQMQTLGSGGEVRPMAR